MLLRFLLSIAIILGSHSLVQAQEEPVFEESNVQNLRATDLPLPRYVTIRSDKAYVRSGPALRYPIKWVYKRKGFPVEIVQEFDHWRKIRDFDGEEGWVHKSLMSGERSVIIMGEDLVEMREGFSQDARLVAKLEPNVIASLEKCIDDWCYLAVEGYSGWVERNLLWGIYAREKLD